MLIQGAGALRDGEHAAVAHDLRQSMNRQRVASATTTARQIKNSGPRRSRDFRRSSLMPLLYRRNRPTISH